MIDWRFILENKILHRKAYAAAQRNYEKSVQTAMLQIKGDLFIDIGTNNKFYAKLLEQNFKRIITVDPNPKWKADIRIALSNFSGVAPFYTGDDNRGAESLLCNPHILGRTLKNHPTYNVNVKTFDDLRLLADLVKIDVEGAEFDVLDGMRTYLPKNVVVELHDERREIELEQRMMAKGYSSTKIDNTHWLFKL